MSQMEHGIPVGKDSLSMSTEWNKNGEDKLVVSPLSLIVSGFAPIQDISIAVTPELKETKKIFITFYRSSKRPY